MQFSAKKKLDFLELKERLLPLIFTASCLIGFVLIIFTMNNYWERRAAEYKSSIKTSISGTFKGKVSSRSASSCYFEIYGDGVIPIPCSGVYYHGQQVKLTRVTNAQGKYYYEIDTEP